MQEQQAGPSPAQLSLASAAPGLLDDITLARLRLQRIAERAQVTLYHEICKQSRGLCEFFAEALQNPAVPLPPLQLHLHLKRAMTGPSPN